MGKYATRVDPTPVREYVLSRINDDFTFSDLAKAIGWYRNDDHERAEVTRLKRALGIDPQGYTATRSDILAKIVIALGKSPVDFDF